MTPRFLKRSVRAVLRRLGVDLVSYPVGDWLLYRERLAQILRSYQIECVIDVGAHRGEYGQLLRGLGFTGRIVSFEPVKDSFAALQRAAQGDARWSVHNFALGNEDGAAQINVAKVSTFSSFRAMPPAAEARFKAEMTPTAHDNVLVRRLDTIWDACVGPTGPILLKTDTQGYDSLVIQGIGTYVEHFYAIQTELSVLPIYIDSTPWLAQIQQLETLGFTVSGLYSISTDSSLRTIEFDGLFVRR